MSELGRKVEQWLTGRPEGNRGAAEPTRRELMAEMEARHGSGRKAAAAAGIPESSWRRIKKTDSASPQNAGKLDAGARDIRAKRISNDDIKLKTKDRHSTGKGQRFRERELTAKNLKMQPGAAEKIHDAYVKGGSEAAAKEFLDQVKDPWYRDALDPDGEFADGDYGFNIMTIG